MTSQSRHHVTTKSGVECQLAAAVGELDLDLDLELHLQRSIIRLTLRNTALMTAVSNQFSRHS